jgi:proline iminopeptidase
MMHRQQQFIASDSVSIEIFTGGSGDLTVCTTHPFFAETTEGGILSDPFVDFCRVVAVSPRGLGGSTPQQGSHGLGMNQLVEDLEATRQALRIDHWVFAGSSASGFIGLLYALRFPHVLQGLILSVTGSSWPRVTADPESIFSPYNPAWSDACTQIPKELPLTEKATDRLSWFQLRADLWALGDATGYKMIAHGEQIEDHVRAWFEEAQTFDVTEQLAEIRVPTLIIGGQCDDVWPIKNSLILNERIPGSQLVVFEECGHRPMLESPEHYRRTVQDFLRQLVA